MSSIYLTLPSDADQHIHPLNTASNFITTFKRTIDLDSDYKVALAEIHIPIKWKNITTHNNKLYCSYAEMTEADIEADVINPNITASKSDKILTLKIDLSSYKYGITRSEYMRKLDQLLKENDRKKVGDTIFYYNGAIQCYSKNTPYNIAMGLQSKHWQILFETMTSSFTENIAVFEDFFEISCTVLRKQMTKIELLKFDPYANEISYKLPSHYIYLIPPATEAGVIDLPIHKLKYDEKGFINYKEFRESVGTTNTVVKIVLKTTVLQSRDKVCYLQPGYYEHNSALVDEIIRVLPVECKEQLNLSVQNDIFIMKHNGFRYCGISFKDNDILRNMLGITLENLKQYFPDRPATLTKPTTQYIPLYNTKFTAALPVDINRGVSNLFIYSDIVSQQIIGESEGNLLRVIQLNSDGIKTIHFGNSAHYKNISNNKIDSIQVVIKSDTGEEIEFINGKSIITLHLTK